MPLPRELPSEPTALPIPNSTAGDDETCGNTLSDDRNFRRIPSPGAFAQTGASVILADNIKRQEES
jgi:hypothetical protein